MQNEQDPQNTLNSEPGDTPATPLQDSDPDLGNIQPPVQQPVKSKKPLIITLVILGTLILAGLGYWGYSALTNTPKTTESSDVDPVTESAQERVIDDLRRALADTNATALSDSDAPFAFRLGTNKYLTNPVEGVVILGLDSNASTQADVDSIQDVAEDTLKENGFTLNSLSSEPLSYNGKANYWTSDELVCLSYSGPVSDGAAYSPTTDNSTNSAYFLTVRCAVLVDYQDTATEFKPFYDAYAKSGTSYKDNMIFNSLTVKESETDGYKTANISLYEYGASVGGFAGLFYQTPNGEWSYFTGAQAVIDCSAYNTADIRKAYVGDQCYDGAKVSTVTL